MVNIQINSDCFTGIIQYVTEDGRVVYIRNGKVYMTKKDNLTVDYSNFNGGIPVKDFIL